MIRVGFVFGFVDEGWLGGLNYFRNLFAAILALPDRRIEPVVLIGDARARGLLTDFPPVTVVHNGIFTNSPRWAQLRWAAQRLAKRDLVLELVLRRHGIAVLSHSNPIAGGAIPAICWIPDFQHVHLPEFFGAEEIAARNRGHAALAETADRVLLSSRHAERDFRRLYPDQADKSRVLPFVAAVPDRRSLPSRADLAQRYGLPDRYFLVANQFWAHKNHRLIIDALRILKGRNAAVRVLATGNAGDHRAPGFYDELMRYAAAQDVLDCFIVLGVIPRGDLLGLMCEATATINPSRFEGWNSAIEEAKTLGVRVIASDIAVHREQAAPGAIYVAPDDPEALAAAMLRLRTEDANQPQAETAGDFATRRDRFARAYEDIALELCRPPKARRAG
jgi:glycosyltransferase involved in cell wall biosynthesis